MEEGEIKLEADIKRAKEMQEVAPKPEESQPPAAKGEQKRQPKTEQQKTEQAAKVAK